MTDKQMITEVVQQYFNGTYQGDAEKLRSIFHPQAHIVGSINGEIVDWPVEDFITRVTSATSAAEKKEKFDKKIVTIDITGEAAMVKAQVQVGEYLFTDYITLLKMGKQWIIRHKSFST